MERISLSLREIEKDTSERPKEKATRSKVRGIVPRKKFRRFKFLVKSTETYSNPAGHLVSVMYPKIRLMNVYVRPRRRTPLNSHVRVWCTCPAWQYWGAAYNATEGVYNLDKKEHRAPNVRDPQRTYKLCKHVLAVFKNLDRVSFPKLIERFIQGYYRKQLQQYLEQEKKKMRRQHSAEGLFTRLLDKPEQDDFLDGFEDWQAVLPVTENFLKDKGWGEEKRRAFVASMTEENLEDKLLEIGAII